MLPSLLMSWITITFCLSSSVLIDVLAANKPSATQTRETVVLHETFGALRFNLTWQNPIFTAEAYKASVSETAKITVRDALMRASISLTVCQRDWNFSQLDWRQIREEMLFNRNKL